VNLAAIRNHLRLKRTAPRWLRPCITWFIVVAVITLLVPAGLSLRRWVWTITDPIRFVPDTRRQCYWAIESTGPEGFLNQYEKMAIQTRQWSVWLDYVPLRLLVMREWGVYLRSHDPQLNVNAPLRAWKRSFEFSAPLLYFNAGMDALAAVCAFCLTRLWIRRSWKKHVAVDSRPPPAGIWQGLVAAGLIWLHPANLLSAYAWPTWDSWIVPLYLLAALLASLDWWFCSGLALAIGAMLKGQQLAIIPVFILWPLLQGRLNATAKWTIGLVFGIAIIASPWLLTSIPADQLAIARQKQASLSIQQYPPELFTARRAWNSAEICWLIGGVMAVVAAGVATKSFGIASRGLRTTIIIALPVALAVGWPWMLARNRSDWMLGITFSLAAALATVKLRPSRLLLLLAAIVGISLLLGMRLFDASSAWWQCGFAFGSSRWHWIASSLTDNLPCLMFERFGWSQNPDDVAFTLNAIADKWPAIFDRHHWWPAAAIDITSKELFNTIFTIVLLIVGAGISRIARRNDRRMLVALTTPWLVFFIFPVEIHGRYSLYPAAVSALCIGESVGMALMGLFLMLASTVMILDALLQGGNIDAFGALLSNRYPALFTPQCGHTLYKIVNSTHPDLAWAIFLTGGVFLYFTFVPTAPPPAPKLPDC
jgi:hypothetical protein